MNLLPPGCDMWQRMHGCQHQCDTQLRLPYSVLEEDNPADTHVWKTPPHGSHGWDYTVGPTLGTQ